MRPGGTFIKLFLDNLLVMVVILTVAGLFTYQRLDAGYQREMRQNQDRLAHIAVVHFQELWPLNQARIDQISKKLLHEPATRLTVIAADGTVLGDSQGNPLTMSNHKTDDRPEVLAALAGRAGNHERLSETLSVQYRYVALPVTHTGRIVAAVRVATPVKTIAEGGSLLRNAVIWSALAGTAAAVGLGLLTSWIWYAPLRRITKAAKQIASGDLSSKAGIGGNDRLADLAGALNSMRDNLGKYLGQITSQHQDFQAVLANLQEGVIATDAEGRVVLMNQAAGDLFSVEPHRADNKPLQSVLPVLDILEFHEQAMASEGPLCGQLDLEVDAPAGRRSIEVHGTKVPPGPSNIVCLLVVRDVSELAAATAMKTQFVANASHELRTPLATIRAAVDSLTSAEDKQESAKLADVLDRHVRRLEEMTKDLLDLHMVESGKFALNLQEVTLGDLAEWTRTQFAAQTQETGLDLSISACRPEQKVRSDRKLLELILRNLIENAIKFTPSGGRVECAFDVTAEGAVLRVSDTGCGIRLADQPRVFERFYQGDAARSGLTKTRGTGLGLAIVKHATDRLGAKIDLQSELGHGTTVTLLLPIQR